MPECDWAEVHVTIGCPLRGFVATVYSLPSVQQLGWFPFSWMFVIVSPLLIESHVEGRHPWVMPFVARSNGESLGKFAWNWQLPGVPRAELASKTSTSSICANPTMSYLSTPPPGL